jgi:hypothetical protein
MSIALAMARTVQCVSQWPSGSLDTEIRCFCNQRIDMHRRKFSREFKFEAMKLVRDPGYHPKPTSTRVSTTNVPLDDEA